MQEACSRSNCRWLLQHISSWT